MNRNFNDHVSRDKIKISLRHVKKLTITKKKEALVSGLNIQIKLESFGKSREKAPNLAKLVSGNVVLCGLLSKNNLARTSFPINQKDR